MSFDQQTALLLINQIEEQAMKISLLETLLTEHVRDWEKLYEQKMETGASDAWKSAQSEAKRITEIVFGPTQI
jgi:hypothetical protein